MSDVEVNVYITGVIHSKKVSLHMQGSHSHGKSGKVMEKFVVMESHGKVMENNKNTISHGKVKILP